MFVYAIIQNQEYLMRAATNKIFLTNNFISLVKGRKNVFELLKKKEFGQINTVYMRKSVTRHLTPSNRRHLHDSKY